MINILNTKSCNLNSIYSAIHSLGYDVEIISMEDNFHNASRIIIPGVGFFPKVIKNIDNKDVIYKLKDFSTKGNPILGICLGMQLLADYSYEGEVTQGFGLISGKVEQMESNSYYVLPHVGWNNVKLVKKHVLFNRIKDNSDFYFVHSYQFNATNSENVLATSKYLEIFNSVVCSNNIIGTQFHPEKSQKNGLKFLDNFCSWQI